MVFIPDLIEKLVQQFPVYEDKVESVEDLFDGEDPWARDITRDDSNIDYVQDVTPLPKFGIPNGRYQIDGF